MLKFVSIIFAAGVVFLSIFGVFEHRTLGFQRAMENQVPVVQTATPKQTIESFERLSTALEEKLEQYGKQKDFRTFLAILGIVDGLVSLIDLSDVPKAYTRDFGVHTVVALIEVLASGSLFPIDALPDDPGAISSADDNFFLLPGTPLALVRIEGGSREGEYLFKGSAIDIAPRLLRGMRADGKIEASWDWRMEFDEFTGPWFPLGFTQSVPSWLKLSFMGTPVWKAILTFVAGGLIFFLLRQVQTYLQVAKSKKLIARPTVRLAETLSAVVALVVFSYLLHYQIHITGAFAGTVYAILQAIWVLALATLFWFGATMCIVSFFSGSTTSLDNSLIHLLSRIFAVIGVVWILAYGAQTLGFPLLSVLAGLGIGGIAAALAIRPTLENLIGGLILYLDKPIRVGDFCQFGNQMGTVERIGIRSTQVRALDRTLIKVPNSSFSNTR